MDKRGFTLIELLIVVTIIGILSAVAVTAYVGVTKKSARSEAYSNLESLRLLEEQAFAESAAYAPTALCSHLTIRPDGTCFVPNTVLLGFKPGSGRSFDYAVTQNIQLTGGGNSAANPPTTAAAVPPASCFVATATGVAGTRVEGDIFAIDCNNMRNF